ncbi:prepilin-type N-terminal cleavage/methylation domain-containing protein [Streptohalobacillus salinus]|uniref:Prepilin-type N-terminal cleavage/methylation domain-containing protein n=1 Tax=Streptohalobacillus salinus TaxID=621096 RepID=A0A2V3WD40_9BACI|nr:type II secretion system protein [Streptohalobacillus salinus]PXW92014.1 prepilin-type N-terminal cleavage/methylation domain-containing protein [Streptohalobacillus salinus]
MRGDGLTLVELLAVIAVLSIILAVLAPSVSTMIEHAEEEACHIGAVEIERRYEAYLTLEGLDHLDALFLTFLNTIDVDSTNHHYRYSDGRVNCSKHGASENNDESEEVPHL